MKRFLLKSLGASAAFLIIVLVVFTALGHCQSINATPVAVNQNGVPLASTLVTVCNSNPGVGTCSSLVTLFTDITLTTTCSGSLQLLNNQTAPSVGSGCSNPGFTDRLGNVIAFAGGGSYWCQFSGATITTYSAPCPSSSNSAFNPASGYPQLLFDGVFACNGVSVSCAQGAYVGTAPAGCCSEAVVGLAPTLANPFVTTEYQNNVTSTNGIVGLLHTQNGNNGLFHVRGFWRMSFRAAISAISNSRFYWGLGVWANGSTLGTNGTNILGTTAFATDTPNHTFLGFRWSSTTDTDFKCLAIQAGSSPTTVIVDTGVVGDSNLHTFDITLDSGNTIFTCYVDGKNVGSIAASTLTFTPVNTSDALSSLFFTGDDKNIATGGIQFTLASMYLSLRQ